MRISAVSHPNSRRGTTMVELSVATTVISVIFGTLAVSMHRMDRTNAQVRDEFAATANLSRLSQHFRRDTHAATTAEKQMVPDDEANVELLLLSLPDGEFVEYKLVGNALQRIRREGRQIVHRDSFELVKDASVAIAVAEKDGATTASIVIASGAMPGAEDGVATHMEAVVALDHFHTKGGQE